MHNNISIIFLSNSFTSHQVDLSDALWKITEGNYTFIETSENSRNRQRLGKNDSLRPYVMVYWGNETQVSNLIKEADIVISGSAPEKVVQERVRVGKVLLRYSERPLKKGLEIWRFPDRFFRWNWRNPCRKPIYLLCASAYAASDYRKFGLFRNKTYKWGYFPVTRRYSDPPKKIASKNDREILWCGRFLDWKHPDDALTVARILKKDGYTFQMKFIGAGMMEEKLRQQVQEYRLEDCVCFLGRMTTEQVREHMETAGIYLFTSDRQEGWGAVLNESMNSGCAVIASHAVGSTPYLVENGKNGLVYESGNVEQLTEKVKYLLDQPEEQKRLGLAAYGTIIQTWNAQIAAERLIELSEHILNGDDTADLFISGPCSRAD